MSGHDRAALAGALALIGVAAAAISLVRPTLAANVARVKETSDVFPLPPPEQLPVLSLGYRSAAADLLWAQTLVLQGLRLGEKRRFEHGARYFESIFALDPTYRRPYLLLDSILAFSAQGSTVENIRDVRRLFEFGLTQRPNDAQLFVQAGNFMAYIAPGVLPQEEHASWRLAGAKLLMRGAELSSGQEATQLNALSATSLLNRAGEREAAVAFLERTYEITEDPDVRKEILRQLGGLKAQGAAERAQAAAKRFEAAWRGELPFVSRAMMLLLGPKTDTFGCAGPDRSRSPGCAGDWKSWTEKPQR